MPRVGISKNRNRNTSGNARICVAVAVAASAQLLALNVTANNATWTAAAADQAWATGGNWDTGTAPGVADGVTFNNNDTAFFSQPSTFSPNVISIDPNRNIGSIVFGATSTQYNIGSTSGNALYLSAGGMIQVASNVVTATSDAVSAPMVLMGDYTFDNESSNNSSGLKANGSISGGVTSPITITLTGVNLATASPASSNSQVNGVISDGSSSAVSVLKNGSGVWELKAANTYSGDTTINNGTLRLNGAGSLSGNTNVLVNSGGIVRFNTNGNTGKSLTVNTGGLATGSADTVRTFFTNGVTFNFASATTAVNQAFQLGLSGSVEGQDGVTLINSDSTGKVSFTKSIDLGNLDRPFNIGHSATNDVAGDPDLQVNGVVQGSGGIIKTGPGVLKLNNTANVFSGQLEIQAGTVRINASQGLQGNNSLLVDGGAFDVQGFTQSFPTINVTSGSISGSAGGAVSAPVFSFNVPTGSNATATATLADLSSPSPVLVSGGGKVTLKGSNTYSGGTTVSAGTLQISNLQALGTGGLTVGDGAKASLGTSVGALTLPHGYSLSNSGTLDVANNALVLPYTGSSPIALVRHDIANAIDGGAWDKPGLTSSAAQADANHHTAVGYAEASDLGLANGGTWDGQTLPAGQAVLVKYTYYGDQNLDGVVNLDDFSIFVDGFNGLGSGWLYGDFNYDGKIDQTDFAMFVNGYNLNPAQNPPLSELIMSDSQLSTSQKSALLSVVPEPTSLGIFAIGTGAMVMRRRRKV